MTRVYVTNAKAEERSGLRLILLDLNMELVGEAADWPTTLAQAPLNRTDLLLIDWSLVPHTTPGAALDDLHKVCPALVIVLISSLDARQQAAQSSGADAFISRGEMPDRVIEHLRNAAAIIRS